MKKTNSTQIRNKSETKKTNYSIISISGDDHEDWYVLREHVDIGQVVENMKIHYSNNIRSNANVVIYCDTKIGAVNGRYVTSIERRVTCKKCLKILKK
jgi:hypothetical protein